MVEDAKFVMGWDALCDRDDQLDASVLSLKDRVSGEPWRNEDHCGVGAGLVNSLVEGVEDWDSLNVLPALARRYTSNDIGAVGTVVESVEGAFATGDAGHDKLCVVTYEDAHEASSTTFSAASSIVATVWTFGRFASASSSRPATSLVPSRRTTNGTVGLI